MTQVISFRQELRSYFEELSLGYNIKWYNSESKYSDRARCDSHASNEISEHFLSKSQTLVTQSRIQNSSSGPIGTCQYPELVNN